VAPVALPQEEPEPLPEIVGHIDAEEADTMISDDLAMQHTRYEEGAGQGKQDIINIGVIDRHFEAGETVTLQALKDKGLMPKKVGRMKVLADGELNKPLIVKAEDYSVQAIKMIELTGGTVIILKD
jgi:large subunit ribosomal protein L15